MRSRKTNLLCFVVLCCILSSRNPVNAGQMSFDVLWSGKDFGNSANAAGTITFDPGTFSNLTINNTANGSWIGFTDFSITVTGAKSGNGTFDSSYFSEIYLDTQGATLDFSKDLYHQPTMDKLWGTTDKFGFASGDFNFEAKGGTDAPSSYWFFTIQTNGTRGDLLTLKSFRPAAAATPDESPVVIEEPVTPDPIPAEPEPSFPAPEPVGPLPEGVTAVPEPSTFALAGLGGIGLGLLRWYRRSLKS